MLRKGFWGEIARRRENYREGGYTSSRRRAIRFVFYHLNILQQRRMERGKRGSRREIESEEFAQLKRGEKKNVLSGNQRGERLPLDSSKSLRPRLRQK